MKSCYIEPSNVYQMSWSFANFREIRSELMSWSLTNYDEFMWNAHINSLGWSSYFSSISHAHLPEHEICFITSISYMVQCWIDSLLFSVGQCWIANGLIPQLFAKLYETMETLSIGLSGRICSSNDEWTVLNIQLVLQTDTLPHALKRQPNWKMIIH